MCKVHSLLTVLSFWFLNNCSYLVVSAILRGREINQAWGRGLQVEPFWYVFFVVVVFTVLGIYAGSALRCTPCGFRGHYRMPGIKPLIGYMQGKCPTCCSLICILTNQFHFIIKSPLFYLISLFGCDFFQGFVQSAHTLC